VISTGLFYQGCQVECMVKSYFSIDFGASAMWHLQYGVEWTEFEGGGLEQSFLRRHRSCDDNAKMEHPAYCSVAVTLYTLHRCGGTNINVC